MNSSDLMPTRPNFIPEFFVDAGEAAKFLKINPRTLLQMARNGSVPAHPLGNGVRKTWRFLLSELAEWLVARGGHSSGEDHANGDRLQ